MSAHLVEWSFRFLLLVRVPVASPMDRVTFYLLDVPTALKCGNKRTTSDGDNFPRPRGVSRDRCPVIR